MEKLAEGLQKLDEDNLLRVVQLIHDRKTEATYIKNDVERKHPPDVSRLALHGPSYR